MSSPLTGRARGYSLVEVMISIAVLTVLMGAMMQFMARMQQRYTSQQRVSGVGMTGKTVMELLAIDIGQAGFPAQVNSATDASAVITFSSTPRTVVVTNVAGIFPDTVVQIDVGSNMESVRVISCTAAVAGVLTACPVTGTNSITAVFKFDHLGGVPIKGSTFPYPQGIVWTTPPPLTAWPTNVLRIVGDMQINGSLRYIEYRFENPDPTNCTGRLVRSDSDAFAATQSAAMIIADNLCNTATQGVFAIVSDDTLGTFRYVTQIGAVLIMQTRRQVERGAGGTTQIVFREQNFIPRNIVYARTLARDGLHTLLPAAPSTVISALPAAPVGP